MSMNAGAIGGSGDRPIDSVAKLRSTEEIGGDNSLSVPSVYINNSQALRQAELQGEKVTISDAQVVKAIEHAIKAVQGKTTSLEFSIHQKTKLISVKVLDKDTGETIREIPPEKSLDFVAKLWEMAGILVDERR